DPHCPGCGARPHAAAALRGRARALPPGLDPHYDKPMKPFQCLALAVLATCTPFAQSAADLEKQLDQKISSALRISGAPSVSVAAVTGGKLVYAKAFGTADLAAGRAASAATRYAVGSISKQFTAAALLMLEEQGKLSLDDRVSRYFPALTRSDEVTIRQLLSHTSGYEDYAPQDYIIPDWTRPTTPAEVLDHWA